jgi:hypothetical protein
MPSNRCLLLVNGSILLASSMTSVASEEMRTSCKVRNGATVGAGEVVLQDAICCIALSCCAASRDRPYRRPCPVRSPSCLRWEAGVASPGRVVCDARASTSLEIRPMRDHCRCGRQCGRAQGQRWSDRMITNRPVKANHRGATPCSAPPTIRVYPGSIELQYRRCFYVRIDRRNAP